MCSERLTLVFVYPGWQPPQLVLEVTPECALDVGG
jgi:hypothetical protein